MKDRRVRILLVVLVLFMLIGLPYCVRNIDKKVDWKETYINNEKIPYGTYILYDLLDDVFEKDKIRTVRHTIYNELNDAYYYYEDEVVAVERERDDSSESYIFVNQSFEATDVDLEYLLDFVSAGNNVFISAEKISQNLLDTLNIKIDYQYTKKDGAKYRLTDLPRRVYNVTDNYSYAFRPDSLCELDVRVLGYLEGLSQANFIQIAYDEGFIYLHTTPKAFSNFELLKLNQYDYAFRCLSYLPQDSYVVWDEYQKQGAPGERSMFRVIWADKNLKLALLIILGGIILFVLFRSKRIQRIIPIIEPPRNSSLEFLGTLSNLYKKQEDYQTIAKKRMAFLLDQVRRKYYLPTEVLDDEFMENLSLKSGVETHFIKDLFTKYNDVRYEQGAVSNQQFLSYNEALEIFYRQSNIKK